MLYVSAYGCVLCQQHHVEGDPLYRAHLFHQSRHGTGRLPAPWVANALGRWPSVGPALGAEAVPLWRSLTFRQYARTRTLFER